MAKNRQRWLKIAKNYNGQLRREHREATDNEVNFQLDHADPLVHQIGSAKHKIEVTEKLNNLIHLDEGGLFFQHHVIDLQTGNHSNWHYEGVSTQFSFRERTAWIVDKLVTNCNEFEQERDIARDNLDICYREKQKVANDSVSTRREG